MKRLAILVPVIALAAGCKDDGNGGGGGGGGGGAVCNNNAIEGTETCDGTDLGGETCVTRGYDQGTLTCNSTCNGFVTSGCQRLGGSCNQPVVLTPGTHDYSTEGRDDNFVGTCDGSDGGGADMVFRFDLEAESSVTITVNGDEDEFDTLIYLYDDASCAEANEIACQDDLMDAAADEVIEMAALAAGSYFVVVDAYGELSGSFSIEYATGAPTCFPDNFDNNNTADLAVGAGAGDVDTVAFGYLLNLCPDDVDYYWFGHMGGNLNLTLTGDETPAPSGQILAATFTGVDEETDRPLFTEGDPVSGATTPFDGDLAKGFYFLKLTDSGVDTSGVAYGLVVDHACGDFYDMPEATLDDQQRGYATQIPTDEPYPQELCLGDVDGFLFTANLRGEIVLTFAGGAGAVPAISRVVEDVVTPLELTTDYTVATNGNDLVVTLPDALAGYYFATLTAGATQLAYTLTPAFNAVCEDSEPDTAALAGAEAALVIPTVEPLQLSICTEDEDWFKLTLTNDQLLIVNLTFFGDAADVDIELFKGLPTADSEAVADSGGTSSVESFTYVAAADGAGDYYLRVFTYNGAGETAYTMTLRDTCETTAECSSNRYCNPLGACVASPNCAGDDVCLVLETIDEQTLYCNALLTEPVCQPKWENTCGGADEPNDITSEADLLVAGDPTALEGAVCGSDLDWYRIELTGGVNTVTVNLAFPNGDLDAYLFRGNGGFILLAGAAGEQVDGGCEALLLDRLPAGTYYVLVYPYSIEDGDTYTISATAVDTTTACAGPEDCAQLIPLRSGCDASGACVFAVPDDTVPAGGFCEMDVDCQETADMYGCFELATGIVNDNYCAVTCDAEEDCASVSVDGTATVCGLVDVEGDYFFGYEPVFGCVTPCPDTAFCEALWGEGMTCVDQVCTLPEG